MSTVEFERCKVERETDKALLVSIPEVGDEDQWVPKSVVHDDSEVWKDKDEGTLVISEWFALKKEWI